MAREAVQACLAVRRRAGFVVEEHHEVAEDVHGFVRPAGLGLRGADLGDDGTGLVAVVGVT